MLAVDLSGLIRARIEEEGAISIKDFLTHISKVQNEHFYSKTPNEKNSKFSSIHNRISLFSEIIADWCINFWIANKKPKKIKLIVFCPKSGVLISKILEQNKEADFNNAITIYIVEPNLYFTKIQKQNLKNYFEKITWVDAFKKIPVDSHSIVIANEFFSSLPIEQYTRKDDEWFLNMVTLSTNKQYFGITHLKKLNKNIDQYLDSKYPQVQEGGIIELHDETSILLKNIVENIKEFGGIILLIDQGYLNNDKREFTSTLQATYRKKLMPVFHNLGKSFLSTQLNFSDLKDTLKLYGMHVYGPITQKDFLFSMKIKKRKQTLLKKLPKHKHSVLFREYKNLTSTKHLGHLVKVMAICNASNDLIGFS